MGWMNEKPTIRHALVMQSKSWWILYWIWPRRQTKRGSKEHCTPAADLIFSKAILSVIWHFNSGSIDAMCMWYFFKFWSYDGLCIFMMWVVMMLLVEELKKNISSQYFRIQAIMVLVSVVKKAKKTHRCNPEEEIFAYFFFFEVNNCREMRISSIHNLQQLFLLANCYCSFAPLSGENSKSPVTATVLLKLIDYLLLTQQQHHLSFSLSQLQCDSSLQSWDSFKLLLNHESPSCA